MMGQTFRHADIAHEAGDAVIDPEYLPGGDAPWKAYEAEQRAEFLDRLTDAPPPVLNALRSCPDELWHLIRSIGVSVFTDNPEQDENSRVQAVLAALQAAPALARSMRAADAGKASGNRRRAKNAQRDERILNLWAAGNPRLSDSQRAEHVRRKLGRWAPSVKTIFRVLRKGRNSRHELSSCPAYGVI
jgi:hypothetical protein